jgi:hypothetical protein
LKRLGLELLLRAQALFVFGELTVRVEERLGHFVFEEGGIVGVRLGEAGHREIVATIELDGWVVIGGDAEAE